MKGNKMKTKKCIKCGVRLHLTDWIILKEMNTLPICDNCSLIESESNTKELKDKDELINLFSHKSRKK
jgi:acetyl-CoA carboxylase beta subunit